MHPRERQEEARGAKPGIFSAEVSLASLADDDGNLTIKFDDEEEVEVVVEEEDVLSASLSIPTAWC